jgi:hypothetical protein
MREKEAEKKKQEKIEHEKALFDFDNEINELEGVEERYPVVKPIPEPEKEKESVIKKTMRPACLMNNDVLADLHKLRVKNEEQEREKKKNERDALLE